MVNCSPTAPPLPPVTTEAHLKSNANLTKFARTIFTGSLPSLSFHTQTHSRTYLWCLCGRLCLGRHPRTLAKAKITPSQLVRFHKNHFLQGQAPQGVHLVENFTRKVVGAFHFVVSPTPGKLWPKVSWVIYHSLYLATKPPRVISSCRATPIRHGAC